jgi:ferric-dicitrate binding protein FerR (iron transport regulator)
MSEKQSMKKIEYIALLSKRLGGELNPEEARLLEQWLQQSPDHVRIAEEFALIWEKSENYTPAAISLDLDADYQKILAKINEKRPGIKVLTLGHKLMRAAAAVAVLSLALWGYQHLTQRPYFDATEMASATEIKQLKLSDGTKVWLRNGSSLEFARSYSDKAERLVKLKGEAYFEVAHDSEHPFSVEINQQARVEVLGTEFNVQQTSQAINIAVKSGKVKFDVADDSKGPVLTANQKASLDIQSRTIKVSGSNLNELAWQTGYLQFVNTPLKTVLSDLENFYGAKIHLENDAIADCPHTALLKDQTLSSVLQGLAVAYSLKVNQLSKNEYTLVGGNCR